VNPYDEHALTEAARIKQSMADIEVVAVCLGKPAAENTLRSAMAMGADRSLLIESDGPATASSPPGPWPRRSILTASRG
jgi:electron transfer flavoprotein beta subunit